MRSLRVLLCVCLVVGLSLWETGVIWAADYESDVLPVLRKHCYSCHDGRKQKAGLRLDVRAAAHRGGESGQTGIVPGKAATSEIIRRIQSPDDELRMPPEGDGLSQEEIQTLIAWVDAGALWPDALSNERQAHWAFVKPTRPGVPTTSLPDWVRNPVDAFVSHRLAAEGLKPSPEADKVTLCRRLHLDLIGLPPSPQEVAEFVADTSPNAYEKLVDRLLASPHYGERWGRLWLDAARYADSDGFEKDKPRFVYFYRDWVIGALNRDLPYNQFLIEQIAGDLLPDATQDQIVATGFLRNSMINEEGGIDPEQFRMEAMFDRMDAIGKGMLGLTIQCAQCHNHKYDPLTQEEYYQLFAFINNSHEGSVSVYTPAEQMARAEILRQVAEIEDDLKHRQPDWQAKVQAWEAEYQAHPANWVTVRPTLDTSGGQKHTVLDDGSILAAGYAPTKHTTEFTVTTDLPEIRAVRLELLNDANLPRGGPGRSIYGLFGLTEFKVVAGPQDGSAAASEVKIVSAEASANASEAPLNSAFSDKTDRKRIIGPIEFAIDGKDETAWSPDIGGGRSNVPQEAVFVFEHPIRFEKGATLTFKLTQNHGGWNSDDNQNNNLGRFRFSVSATQTHADLVPARARQALKTKPANRSPAQWNTLFSYWRTTVADWRERNDEIEHLWKTHPRGSSQLVALERDNMRPTHLLKRGDFLKPGDVVSPGTPRFLHALKSAGSGQPNRLDFARWLGDAASPTTARAAVNRTWQALFGIGLVATTEDFGTQCEPPSHPQLLDWLAVEFVEPSVKTGVGSDAAWSMKRLVKLIVTSATYRQSSRVTSEGLAKDPQNRLYSRAPRFRVDAEVVRDIALATSGLLNSELGGPSVHPPIPGFLMLPPASYGPKVWIEDTGANRYRRAMYTFRFRSVPYPPLQAFDAPNGDFSCVRRSRSNTPIQALTGLNEPVFVECARALGLRILKEGGETPATRLRYAFQLVTSRVPTPSEEAALLQLLNDAQSRYAQPDAQAESLASSKPEDLARLPAGTTASDWAAWTVVSRVLLNLDETLTRE